MLDEMRGNQKFRTEYNDVSTSSVTLNKHALYENHIWKQNSSYSQNKMFTVFSSVYIFFIHDILILCLFHLSAYSYI